MKDLNLSQNLSVDDIREPFDYTKWQKGLFDGMPVEEIGNAAARCCKENPRSS